LKAYLRDVRLVTSSIPSSFMTFLPGSTLSLHSIEPLLNGCYLSIRFSTLIVILIRRIFCYSRFSNI